MVPFTSFRATSARFLAYSCIMQNRTVALAFSGGLDTSYCVPRLAEDGWSVQTVYVDTGGTSPADRAAIRRQAEAVAPVAHHEVDARGRVYQRFVRFLIQGNVLRGEVYPLSVAAERTQQALSVVEVARAIGAPRWPMAPPVPATTRSASTSRSGCWPPSWRS